MHDPHNVSAIFRTCDAVGIPKVSLVYNIEKFPKIGKKSSASAFKWVEREKHNSIKECYESLRLQGFKIFASQISDDAVDLYELDLTGKTAIVIGNEHRGISEEAGESADLRFKIPMYGMVQSLNASVSAAVVIYEALRQRRTQGKYEQTEISEDELNSLIKKWSKK